LPFNFVILYKIINGNILGDYKMMDNYGNIMKTFKKSERSDKKENNDNLFIKIAKMIFNEYGIGLFSEQTLKMIKGV
jgi:hypothetical protein